MIPADPGKPPPPPLPPRPAPAVFDGSFVGPLLPPPGPRPMAPAPIVAVALPEAPEAIRTLPLGTGRLVALALDLLTRPDAGLRSASFYPGFVLLVTVAPVLALVGLAYLVLGDRALATGSPPGEWASWMVVAAIPATIGYLVVSIESRALATAVIGGRAEGRPLRLRESIAISRLRFWPVLWGQMIAGMAGLIGGSVVSSVADGLFGPVDAIDTAVQLVAGLVIGAPFVYVTAGIVLGEVGLFPAIARSFRLFGARKRLALVVSAFGAFSQLIVLLGVAIGLDSTERIAAAVGLLNRLPVPLVAPIVAVLVFALGTLTFLVAAIAAAPAVFAFAALTHYTHGLELGRLAPARVRHAWDPWVTPGLGLAAIIAVGSLVMGVIDLTR